MLLDQLETDYTAKLYFCMKRPQWSVYTGHVVAISYSVCTVCVHHVSRVVFMYQVLDGGFFRTVKDEFRKVYYTKATSVSSYLSPFASICIKPDNDMCSGLKIHYYYLRGEKYEQINVWKKRQGPHRVFVQSFIDSEREIEDLDSFKKFKVPTFHCIIQVYEHSVINSDASLVDMIHFQFHPIKIRYIQLNDKEAMVDVHVSNCKDTDNCQRVLKLNSSYVRISVMTMVFSGWKVHSCLYGGVSFHEKESLEKDDIKRTYTEIYDLCDNVTNLETTVETSRRVGRKVETSTRVESSRRTKPSTMVEPSTFVTNKKYNRPAPYHSASNETLIVIYSEPQYTLNVSFRISHSQCRGVFVNPCPLKKYAKYPLTFPQRFENRILHYPSSVTNSTDICLHVQLSLQFMFTGGKYNRQTGRVQISLLITVSSICGSLSHLSGCFWHFAPQIFGR